MAWTVKILNATAARELDALPAGLQAKFSRIRGLIENSAGGLRGVANNSGHVKHIELELWENRMNSRSGAGRAICIEAEGQQAVVLRTFVKKDRKMPRREIDLARRRAREEGLP